MRRNISEDCSAYNLILIGVAVSIIIIIMALFMGPITKGNPIENETFALVEVELRQDKIEHEGEVYRFTKINGFPEAFLNERKLAFNSFPFTTVDAYEELRVWIEDSDGNVLINESRAVSVGENEVVTENFELGPLDDTEDLTAVVTIVNEDLGHIGDNSEYIMPDPYEVDMEGS